MRTQKKKLADAKKELDDGAAELATQRANLESQLAEPRKKNADGWAAYNDGMATLESGAAQLADGQKQVDEGYAKANESEAKLDAGKKQLEETDQQLTGLEQGKQGLWLMLASSGITPTDTTDATAVFWIDALLQQGGLDEPNTLLLTQLKGGLQALAAQNKTSEQARAEWQAGKDAFDAQEPGARQEIATARATLDATQTMLNEKSAELAAGRDALHDARKSLEAGEAEIKKNVDTANAAFAEAETKLADGRAEYQKGVTELADGKKDLAEGEAEYADKKAEAEQKLGDAATEIADAEQEIADIEPGEWYVFDRSGNTSYASYGSNADKIANIAKVFPVFFFLVAALVALTTMTRMVEEERGQIGTLKALGYSRGRIAGKYLGYAALASICGSVFGMTLGMKLFPALIVNAYNIMYDVPQVLTPFHASYGLLAAGVAVACTLVATLNACWAVLRENPARLMLPKAPKAGKRIFLEYLGPLWRRMKFTHKVTARNLFLYKKRFFMTVIGISGCTALLLTGFGVRDSISHIVTKQFDELYQYQLILGVDDEEPLPSSELKAILNDDSRITEWMPAMQNNGEVVPEKGLPKDSVTIFVPESTERLPEYFHMRHRTTGETIPFGEASVVITEKLAERQKLQVGDTITLKNHDDVQASLTITDICENYVNHAIYLSPAGYEAAFGQAAQPGTVLCKLPEAGQDTEALSSALLECPEVQGVQFTTELSASFEKTLSSIDTIVMVLIVCAAALAFVVLYNLTNINIAERAKEIATIKVLGFYDGEVSAYIYRETALLSLIGAVAGLGLGVVLHQFVIRTAEVDMVMFGRAIDPPSYLYSLLLTLLFSAIVSAVMYRKLKKIDMVDSMKAPE